MSAGSPLLVERNGSVMTLTLNRPDRRNALSPALIEALLAALAEATSDVSVRAVVLRGSHGHFCSGFDIQSMTDSSSPGGARSHARGQRLLESLMQGVRCLRVPLVAALEGSAVGAGLDLAICCDFRVAGEACRLGITPARLGVVYNPAGIARFVALIGPGAARELFLSGRLITAQRALQVGLVHEVVPDADVLARAADLAGVITTCAPLAVEAMKWILTRMEAIPPLSDEDMTRASQLAEQAFLSQDRAEARRAFLEKRAPMFRRM